MGLSPWDKIKKTSMEKVKHIPAITSVFRFILYRKAVPEKDKKDVTRWKRPNRANKKDAPGTICILFHSSWTPAIPS